jgi:hypothetical protein
LVSAFIDSHTSIGTQTTVGGAESPRRTPGPARFAGHPI